MSTRQKIFGCILTLLFTCPVLATDVNRHSIGLGYGIGNIKVSNVSSSKVNVDNYNINYGYYFNRDYQLNVTYSSVNSNRNIVGFSNLLTGLNYSVDALMVDVQRNFWLSNDFAVYGKLGAYYYDYQVKVTSSLFSLTEIIADTNDSGLSYSYGVGTMYQFDNNFEISLEYSYADMKDLKSDVINFGVRYHF